MTLSKDLTDFIASAHHYHVVTLGMANLLLEIHQALKGI